MHMYITLDFERFISLLCKHHIPHLKGFSNVTLIRYSEEQVEAKLINKMIFFIEFPHNIEYILVIPFTELAAAAYVYILAIFRSQANCYKLSHHLHYFDSFSRNNVLVRFIITDYYIAITF
jgi:hypothetical protein